MKISLKKLYKEKKGRDRKDKSRKISPLVDSATGVDCCSLAVPWLKWWPQLRPVSRGGSPQNMEFNGLCTSRFRWECPTIFPCGGDLYTISTLWNMALLLWKVPEMSVGEHRGSLMVYDTSQGMPLASVQLSLLCPIRRNVPIHCLTLLDWVSCVKEDFGRIKKHYPTSGVKMTPQQSTLLTLQMVHCFE